MIRLPWVIRLAIPAITNEVASVAISALIRKYVAITPLIRPTSRPTRMPSAIANPAGMCWASCAAVAPASPYTAPTERSIPPETRTSVPAAAMIRVADCWSRMLSRLDLVANEPLATVSTMNRITNGTTIPADRTLPSLRF